MPIGEFHGIQSNLETRCWPRLPLGIAHEMREPHAEVL
jgi:hypothetical protein